MTRRIDLRLHLAALALVAIAVGCSSSPASTSSDVSDAAADSTSGDAAWVLPDAGATVDYPDSPEGQIAMRLASCRGVEPGCHSEGNAVGLVLGRTPAQDFAELIGVKAVERPDLLRVAPGDAGQSWLYLKVAGDRDAGVQTPMPLGTDGDPAFAAQLADWIGRGAPNPFADAGP